MYADADFYQNEYFGEVVPEAKLDSFLSRASDSVDQLTFSRIQEKGGFEKLTAFQQRQVKMAVCVQAEFLYGTQDMPEWIQSYSAGTISVTRDNSGKPPVYSKRAMQYLKPTGLMYRGFA